MHLTNSWGQSDSGSDLGRVLAQMNLHNDARGPIYDYFFRGKLFNLPQGKITFNWRSTDSTGARDSWGNYEVLVGTVYL